MPEPETIEAAAPPEPPHRPEGTAERRRPDPAGTAPAAREDGRSRLWRALVADCRSSRVDSSRWISLCDRWVVPASPLRMSIRSCSRSPA